MSMVDLTGRLTPGLGSCSASVSYGLIQRQPCKQAARAVDPAILLVVAAALALGTAVFPFALSVTFAACCSFAMPIGYQTNLLVMGRGQYRFRDFVTAGLRLVCIVGATFSLFVPWHYGVP
jgi:hypothetical protein